MNGKRKKKLRAAFNDDVFGPAPQPSRLMEVLAREIENQAINGAGRIVERRMRASFSGGEITIDLALVLPEGVSSPKAIFILPAFCSNRAALKIENLSPPTNWYPASICDQEGMLMTLARLIFGAHVIEAPVEEITARGYGILTYQSNDIFPDHAERALLRSKLMQSGQRGSNPAAIAAWSWGYSLAIDWLEAQMDLRQVPTITYGHSRNGKSVLHHCAYDPRVDLIIAHQSGTGGATLSRSHQGESIKAVTEAYPHWFAPRFKSFAGNETELPVDQHELIALCAPKPILFGNAQRDVWSDPVGAFLAAKAASPIYQLYGRNGLQQEKIGEPNFSDDLVFFMRPGLHGVRPSDWEAFLDFADAHIGSTSKANFFE